MLSEIKNTGVFLLVLILLTGTGCGTLRKASREKKEEIHTIWIKNYDLTGCKEDKVIAKTGFRYIKDSVLVITMRNKSGMEGARIYIYRDSLFVFNRVEKKWYGGSIGGYGELGINVKGGKISEDLIRNGTQKKYFEYIFGESNKVTLYVKKYLLLTGEKYIPEEMMIKMMYGGRVYCYRLKDPRVLVNVDVEVKRIKPGSRYKKVEVLHEVF